MRGVEVSHWCYETHTSQMILRGEILNSIYDTPLSLKYEKRYNEQTAEIKHMLDIFRNTDYQLRVIQKTKPKVKSGDIFLVSPREGLYFYGKVLKTEINTINSDTFVEGKQSVCIFKCKTKTISMDNFEPNYHELLIAPAIVDISYWKKGYFYTIGNAPTSNDERTLDYGFYKLGIPGIRQGLFCTEEGIRMDKDPEIMGMYGITTITGIAAEIEQELILDSSLLE